jgi:hypothetical protein
MQRTHWRRWRWYIWVLGAMAWAPAALAAPLEELPSVAPAHASSAPSLPSSPGMVTLTGTVLYEDRSGMPRAIDQQLIEIRTGDGSALAPPRLLLHGYRWLVRLPHRAPWHHDARLGV